MADQSGMTNPSEITLCRPKAWHIPFIMARVPASGRMAYDDGAVSGTGSIGGTSAGLLPAGGADGSAGDGAVVPVSGAGAGVCGEDMGSAGAPGAGITCSAGASEALSASSEQAASKPRDTAAIAIAKGVRRFSITSSLLESRTLMSVHPRWIGTKWLLQTSFF